VSRTLRFLWPKAREKEFLHLSPFSKGAAAFFAAGSFHRRSTPPVVPLAKGDKSLALRPEEAANLEKRVCATH
jgi:hypothetical protein